jgi:Na+-transporting NADH:ubiquinone oxidoreductase subunit NqrB
MQPIHFFRDPRHFQIIFQSAFLTYGIFFLSWQQSPEIYFTYQIAGIITQTLCELIFNPQKQPLLGSAWWRRWWQGIPSALISSFGLCLFLKTNSIPLAAAASALAILSKYVIRFNGKHLFNPSALAIVVAVLFSGNAWINPGQWGSGAFVFAGVLTLGVIVVTKVQKLDVSLAFLGTYALLLFGRQIIYLDWPLDFFYQTISTGAVLVFSFFMISDPRTTPNHPQARILWAMLVAVLAFYLNSFQFVNGAPVFALVLAQFSVPLFDKIYQGNIFNWTNTKIILQTNGNK